MSVCTSVCLSVRTSFPDNSYSFHQIVLKLGGLLDHEMVQRILIRGYSTPNFDKVVTLLKDFSVLTLFLDNESFSFHPIGFQHGGQLDYEVMQRILFQGYSTLNFIEL